MDVESRCVIDVLPERTKKYLISYFQFYDLKQREQVKYFISDMYRPYVEMAYIMFPNAIICIDKFHFVKLVTEAFQAVRRRVQENLVSKRERKIIKAPWKLFLKHRAKLSQDVISRVDNALIKNEINDAYWLLQSFYKVCDCTSYEEQVEMFNAWIKQASTSSFDEFKKCSGSLKRWKKYIFNTFLYGYSNGVTEGLNNKIKVLKRVSYGLTNFNRLRTRILTTCGSIKLEEREFRMPKKLKNCINSRNVNSKEA